MFALAGFMYSTRRLTRCYLDARRVVREHRRRGGGNAPSSSSSSSAPPPPASPSSSPLSSQTTRRFSTFVGGAAARSPLRCSSVLSSKSTTLFALHQQRRSYATSGGVAETATRAAASEKWSFGSTIHDNLHEKLARLYEPDVVDVVAHHVIDLPSVRLMESYIAAVHQFSGTPWWASLCLATLGMRIFATPFIIMTLRNQWKIKMHAPHILKSVPARARSRVCV